MPRHGHDLEAARGGAETPDPLLELAGWHAEPMLLRRLNLYIMEGILECAALAAAIIMSYGWLHETAPDTPDTQSVSSRSNESVSHPEFFRRLLALPLTVSAIRLTWSLSLFVGYRTFRGTSTPDIIKRRGRLQRRSYWTCSTAMLTCFSCLLMMWHTIMFLLLTGYSPSADEKKFVWCLFGINISCTVMHWCFWRDFVKNHREPDDQDIDAERFHRLEEIYRMYKAKEINIRKYQEVAPVATPRGSPTTCMVCMEDFGRSDWVSMLPCGHFCHPACTNTWLCEKWACPLRCEVLPASEREKAAAQAAAAAAGGAAPPPQPASAAVRISAAARQAAAQQAAAQQAARDATPTPSPAAPRDAAPPPRLAEAVQLALAQRAASAAASAPASPARSTAGDV